MLDQLLNNHICTVLAMITSYVLDFSMIFQIPEA